MKTHIGYKIETETELGGPEEKESKNNSTIHNTTGQQNNKNTQK